MLRRPLFVAVQGTNALRRRIRSSEIWFLALAILVGVAAGLVSLGLEQIARAMQAILFALPGDIHLSAATRIEPLRLLVLPIGGLLLGIAIWASRRRVPVDIVEANALHGGRIPGRDTVTVVAQTVASNGVGASVGLEAAYAQAGGGLASVVGQRLKLRRNDLRTLVGAGAGAAVSAAFGAPLTGAFYAFEIVLGAYTPAAIAPVMGAAIAAAITARSLGSAPYVISAGGMHVTTTADYLLYAVLGALCAGVGIVLMRLVSGIEHLVRRRRLPVYLGPAIGGTLLIPLAMITPAALSGGHGALNLTLVSEVTIASLGIAILVKMLASAISLGFGFRGGLFFASLFLGSLVGRFYQVALAQVPHLHVLAPDDATLVGMAALAVAVVGGPMTIGLLVLEVTHDFAIAGVAIAASVIASTIVRVTFGYSFSTWRLHLRGETIRSGRDIGWMRSLTAGRLMRRDPRIIRGSTTIETFRKLFPLGSVGRVVLTDGEGRYAGIVPTARAWTASQSLEAPVAQLALLRETFLTADMPVTAVMAAFDASEADDLAVLAADGRIVGMLSERHVRRRYAEELERSQRELFGEA